MEGLGLQWYLRINLVALSTKSPVGATAYRHPGYLRNKKFNCLQK